MDIETAISKTEIAVEKVLENVICSSIKMNDNRTMLDMGLDSLDMIEVIMELDDELGLYIADDVLSVNDTLQDIVNTISIILAKQR